MLNLSRHGIEIIATGDTKLAMKQSKQIFTAANAPASCFDSKWFNPDIYDSAVGAYAAKMRNGTR